MRKIVSGENLFTYRRENIETIYGVIPSKTCTQSEDILTMSESSNHYTTVQPPERYQNDLKNGKVSHNAAHVAHCLNFTSTKFPKNSSVF